jgi:hypothetical protein
MLVSNLTVERFFLFFTWALRVSEEKRKRRAAVIKRLVFIII